MLAGATGVWALPTAVAVTLGKDSAWFQFAVLIGAVGSLFWAWYCRAFAWFIAKKLQEYRGITDTASLPVAIGLGIYVGTLASSLLLQYALFRVIRFAIESAL